MTVSVKMPQLGESVTEGTVTRWLKQEGETVQEDEPLLEVSTDKVDTEVPSPASGVLQKILVAEDETVDVGSELATIGDAAEGGGEQPAPQEDAAPAPQTEQPQTEQTSAEQPSPEQPAPDLSQPDVPSSDAPAPAEEPAPQPEAEPAPAAAASPAGGTEVPMPALGESVTEGTVTRWLKQVGDDVAADEPLLEVSTDKVDTEIPSPASGTLLEIRVEEDATVDVGAVLAIIGDKSAAPVEQAAPAPAETAAPTAPAQEAPPAEQQAPEPEPAAEATAPPAPETQEQVEAGGDIVPDAAAPAPSPQSDLSGEQAALPVESTDTDGSGERAYVTPLVRKLATEHGVDLSALTGTGVGGRIRKQDVLDAAAKAAEAAKPEPEPEPEPEAAAAPVAAAAPSKPAAATAPAGDQASLRGTTVKMTRLRKLIARRMVESLQTAAQLTTVVEVDVTQVARLRDRVKKEFAAREGVKLSFLPFFALAAVEALKVHPVVNSTLDADEGTITYPDTENLGIAVDSNRGLVVPVIHNAGDLNLAGLARQIADLAEKTRGGTASPDDLVGGTFTITNTGSRGALFDTPIVNQPQSAILGTGAVVKRPAVINDPNLGEIIAVRSTVYLALSYDHRIVDGADAARFLATVKERLEAGAFESDLGL